MDYKTIYTSDSNEFLNKFGEYEFDIIFADPPYALGSEVIIRKDGKVDYAKASDFMNKWEMPTGEYWEKWFINAYRTLKHGGWLIMYGMDRQTLLFKYYASLAGFDEQQSLYWYFISNFPKATDLSKMIDKNAGFEREVVGTKEQSGAKFKLTQEIMDNGGFNDPNRENFDITAPKTELAKKYDGYKYSVAPLKQTCETIMVFKKPTKTGSVLHDTLAFENGDTTITVSALNIDGNRVATKDTLSRKLSVNGAVPKNAVNNMSKLGAGSVDTKSDDLGRYPAQTFVDEEVAKKLDLQSGLSKSAGGRIGNAGSDLNMTGTNFEKGDPGFGDIGGCSKILHKVQYEEHEHDIFIYQPKVNEGERNNGLDELQEKPRVFNGHSDKPSVDMKDVEKRFTTQPAKNNHPTLKPIDLNAKVLKLFKTPNDQKICFPFAGSGSEILGGLQAGFSQWVACEINQDYVDIANARIKHYTQNEYVQLKLF